jgi:hypothetical protein
LQSDEMAKGFLCGLGDVFLSQIGAGFHDVAGVMLRTGGCRRPQREEADTSMATALNSLSQIGLL